MFLDMLELGYDVALEEQRALALPQDQGAEATELAVYPQRRPEAPPRKRAKRSPEDALTLQLRSTLAAYNLDVTALRELAALGTDLRDILRTGDPPPEVTYLLTVLTHLLRPLPREKITSPDQIAALLMVDMGYLDHEQLRVVCLDTKNQVQQLSTLYKGTLDRIDVRVTELYREAMRLNSAGIIIAHNHPSGDPEPSAEDILLTRQAVEAGRLLDIECLDHLVIGQGRWVSLRQRGMGFSR